MYSSLGYCHYLQYSLIAHSTKSRKLSSRQPCSLALNLFVESPSHSTINHTSPHCQITPVLPATQRADCQLLSHVLSAPSGAGPFIVHSLPPAPVTSPLLPQDRDATLWHTLAGSLHHCRAATRPLADTARRHANSREPATATRGEQSCAALVLKAAQTVSRYLPGRSPIFF